MSTPEDSPNESYDFDAMLMALNTEQLSHSDSIDIQEMDMHMSMQPHYEELLNAFNRHEIEIPEIIAQSARTLDRPINDFTVLETAYTETAGTKEDKSLAYSMALLVGVRDTVSSLDQIDLLEREKYLSAALKARDEALAGISKIQQFSGENIIMAVSFINEYLQGYIEPMAVPVPEVSQPDFYANMAQTATDDESRMVSNIWISTQTSVLVKQGLVEQYGEHDDGWPIAGTIIKLAALMLKEQLGTADDTTQQRIEKLMDEIMHNDVSARISDEAMEELIISAVKLLHEAGYDQQSKE